MKSTRTRQLIPLGLLLAVVALVGCATNHAGYQMAGVVFDDTAPLTLVSHGGDDMALDLIIAADLAERGFDVIHTLPGDVPKLARYTVQYAAQWQQDITWYLLDLRIGIYEGPSELLVASGNARRTSLARKAPDTMVTLALDSLFQSIKGNDPDDPDSK